MPFSLKRRTAAKPKPKSSPASEAAIYQLKITLLGSKPPIWRRVQLPGDVALADLHVIIQIAMGWTDSHLHCFRIGQGRFSSPIPGTDFEDSGDESDLEVFLNEVCPREKTKLIYEYDFGDGWEHEIVVEKITPPEDGVQYPVCLAGKRACPPEDCGGVWGYADMIDALADPQHERHEELKDWIGGEWDAEAFDLPAVNKALARLSARSKAFRRRD